VLGADGFTLGVAGGFAWAVDPEENEGELGAAGLLLDTGGALGFDENEGVLGLMLGAEGRITEDCQIF